jgi:hypothetical protein
MAVGNTLAYYDSSIITAVKYFIVQAREEGGPSEKSGWDRNEISHSLKTRLSLRRTVERFRWKTVAIIEEKVEKK